MHNYVDFPVCLLESIENQASKEISEEEIELVSYRALPYGSFRLYRELLNLACLFVVQLCDFMFEYVV